MRTDWGARNKVEKQVNRIWWWEMVGSQRPFKYLNTWKTIVPILPLSKYNDSLMTYIYDVFCTVTYVCLDGRRRKEKKGDNSL